jgi:flagellar protein FlaJ
MKITKAHWMGIIVGVLLIAVALIFFRQNKILYFLLGVAVVIAALPFLLTVTGEVSKEKEKEDMFLEFSRNLVEAVKSGTPISKSIVNVKDKNYGSLSKHIQKLANQVSLGIPVKQALKIFSDDIGNKVITRSVALISEAEQAGGQIDTVLESVAKSVSEVEDIKKEQKAAVSNLVMQGYIIFFIFIIIMLVTEIKIIPMTIGLASGQKMEFTGLASTASSSVNPEQLSQPFLFLLLVQGLFAGLVIGKLSEGSAKAGIKHSFILVVLAYLMTTGVRALFVK